MNPQVQTFLQQKGYTPPSTSGAPAPNAWYTALKSSAAPAPNYFQRVGQDVSQNIQEGANTLSDYVPGAPNQKTPTNTNAGQLFSDAASIAKNVTSPLWSPVTAAVAPPLGKLMESAPMKSVTDTLSDTAPFKAAADVANAHPEVTKTLGDLAQTGLNMTMVPVTKGAPAAISRASTAVKEAMTETPAQTGARLAQEAATKKVADQAQTVKHAETWRTPASVNRPMFDNARAVLAKSPDTPTFIGQLGLDARGFIDNGKYDTEAAGQTLRDTAGSMKAQMLRPSLQMADYAAPKTPAIAPEVKTAAQKYIKDTFNLPPDDAEKILGQVDDKIAALNRKYPNGMGLTDMNDEAQAFSQHGGFNMFKSAADTNAAIANRSMSDALNSMIDLKAPESVPAADFRAYLSKFYKAADYMDALHGKTAPLSGLQKGAQFVAKYAGAALGEHLTGGIVSAFAGYQIGKALENALLNLSNKARATAITNIQHTNPVAYTKVQEFLKNMTSGNTGIPRLNAPSAIIPEAPSAESQMASRAAVIQKEQTGTAALSEAQQLGHHPPKITAQNLSETTFYHGANTETAAKIRAGGFKGSQQMPGNGMVSLTPDTKVAENYANLKGKGEVMPVKIKPGATFKEYSSMGEYMKAMEASGGKSAGEMEQIINTPYDVVKINDLILAKPSAIKVTK